MFVVSIRYIEYLGVYMSEGIYIPLSYNSSLYRILTDIYARYIEGLQHTKTFSAVPAQPKKAVSCAGTAEKRRLAVPVQQKKVISCAGTAEKG